jgi:hypothetical protein
MIRRGLSSEAEWMTSLPTQIYDRRVSAAKVILSTVLLWLLATGLYAYYYIVTILNLPEPYDAYARNWQFQLLMFSIFRLPFLVLALPLLVIAALVITEYNKRRNARGGSPQ